MDKILQYSIKLYMLTENAQKGNISFTDFVLLNNKAIKQLPDGDVKEAFQKSNNINAEFVKEANTIQYFLQMFGG